MTDGPMLVICGRRRLHCCTGGMGGRVEHHDPCPSPQDAPIVTYRGPPMRYFGGRVRLSTFAFASSGRSRQAPDAFSVNIRSAPAAFNSSIC